MLLKQDVNSIIKDLVKKGVIDHLDIDLHQMSGTTEGFVYRLSVDNEPKYILKIDDPQYLSHVERLLYKYEHSVLLPKLVYADSEQSFIVYAYTEGTTHFHRGSKINWLTRVVNDLINLYESQCQTDKWGSFEEPCQTWRDYIDRGVEEARINVGSLLAVEDYNKVKRLVQNISKGAGDEAFLLHGDCGVHNFIFDKSELVGVIDPSPILGPVMYDFIYAFCSSPDDLNLDTLHAAAAFLNNGPLDTASLVEAVAIELYCRIGISLKHHPHDLADYLEAWNYWKELI